MPPPDAGLCSAEPRSAELPCGEQFCFVFVTNVCKPQPPYPAPPAILECMKPTPRNLIFAVFLFVIGILIAAPFVLLILRSATLSP